MSKNHPDTNNTTDELLGDVKAQFSPKADEAQITPPRNPSERALRQALTWCVVNSGETLGDHPKLLERFREILGMED